MKIKTFFVFTCFITRVFGGCSDNYVVDSESDDFWQGKIVIPISENVDGWSVDVGFDADVESIESALATASGSGKQWILTSRGFDDELTAGTTLELGIIVHFGGSSPKIIDLDFNDGSVCNDGGSDTTTTEGNTDDCNQNYVIETEADDHWQGKIMIPISENVNGWTVNVGFDAEVDSIDSALATASGSGKGWTLTSRGFDDELTAGTTLDLGIIVHFKGASPKIVDIDFNDGPVCAGGGSDTTTTEGNGEDCIQNYEVDTQTETQWQGRIVLTIPEDIDGWVLKIHFNTFVDKVDCALATVTGSGSLWTLSSRGWDDELTAGMTLEIGIIVHFSPTPTLPFINNMILNDLLICSTGSAPTTDPTRPTTTPASSTTTTKSTTTTTKKTTTTEGHHDGECPNLEITNSWDNGLNGRISFTVDHDTDSSWTIYLSWDAKFDQFDCYEGSATSSDGMNYEIDNLAWDGDLTDGDTFTINFLGLFSNGRPKLISATIDQQDICS